MSYLAGVPVNHNSCKMLQLSLVPKKNLNAQPTEQNLSRAVQIQRTSRPTQHCWAFFIRRFTVVCFACARNKHVRVRRFTGRCFCVCTQKACARATLHWECFCVCTQKAWLHGVWRTWLLVGVVLHATPLRWCKIRWQTLWRLDL